MKQTEVIQSLSLSLIISRTNTMIIYIKDLRTSGDISWLLYIHFCITQLPQEMMN